MANSLSPHLYSSCMQYVAMLLMCVLIVAAQDDKITCTIPPVKPFHDTILTCNFFEDLSVTKKDFTVYYYNQEGSAESVLDCWWIQGSLGCYSKAGFTFNKVVGRSLNITVHNVTKATGKYACQVAGYGSNFFETCEFIFQLGQNNTCDISKEQVTLTCYFNEDIQKKQRNFTVYKHHIQDQLTSVVNCWWENEKVNCQVNEGYLYNNEVSSYLRIGIPQPQHEKTEIYSCWHDGSITDRVNTCSLDGEKTEQKPATHLIIGISLGILTAVILLIIVIVVFKKKRAYAVTKGTQNDDESQPINPMKKKRDRVTETFEDFLLTKTKEMYPGMLGGCYFVPPVYLNKVRYKTQSVAGQVVYISDPLDPSDESRDRAMQYVINSLHYMAETQQEEMFVLTQFQYEDYLNNPGRDYRKHRLPIAASLERKKEYKDIGCFDFLIIHRHYGVLVGVVKAVDEKKKGSQDSKQRLEDKKVEGSQVKRIKTKSCKKTEHKESCDSEKTTEDSESRLNEQEICPTKGHDKDKETYNTRGQDNEQRTEDQVSEDNDRSRKDDEIRDDKTKTKEKDKVSDDIVKTTEKQSRDNISSTEELVIKEVSEAIQKFKNADRIIRHLLSDQELIPTVQLILILPNVTSETLLSALDSHENVKQAFLECIQRKSIKDPSKLCLCADHLPNPNATRNVEPVKNHPKLFWEQFMDSSVDTPAMTDDLYQHMVARFCGPSTISYFETPCETEEVKKYQLPKTLDQAVSLTGNLFKRFTLHPGMTDLLDLPRVCLVGPPGTGKTRMLSLVGRKWLSEGHEVYVLYTSPEGGAASIELQTLLQQSPSIPAPAVIPLSCNIDDDKNIDNTITMLTNHLKEKLLFALVDETELEKEKTKKVNVFLRKINECLKNPHIWAASYYCDIAPPGWRAQPLTEPISCPPSVSREAAKGQCETIIKDRYTYRQLLPTDGLPVKIICHQGPKHSEREPRDCSVCGEEVAKFLTKDLHVSDKEIVTNALNTMSDQGTWEQSSTLKYRDVLILFESDITQDVSMITSLKENGFPVQIINSTKERIILGDDSKTVVVSKTGFLYGVKRKVVVYVEGSTNSQEFWNRLRGITSCTSQLVCVCTS